MRFIFQQLKANEFRIIDQHGSEFMFVHGLLSMTDDEVIAELTKIADRAGYTPARQVAKKMANDWYASDGLL